jgi:hypothetical protein
LPIYLYKTNYMKKILILTLAFLFSVAIYGRPRELNPKIIDKEVTDWILDQLRDAGYTVLPEVIVQDTLNHKKQKFSSRYETKGGRGMMMPDWANDSTWSPGQKPPKEYDDLYYLPSKDGKQMRHQKRQDVDAIVDTLVKKNPEIIVNNYYNDDPFFYSHRIGMFYHGGFNYWHYNPFFYDPWYDDFAWGWNPYYGYGRPYWSYPYYNSFYFGYNSYWGWNFGWNYYRPYYGHNYWYGQHNNYYSHNNWNGGGSFQQKPEYGRRERPSNYTQGNPPSNRRFSDVQPQRNRIEAPQNKTTYGESRRSYQPTYETPRMGTRPQYNNSRVGDVNKGRNMGNMNNMGNRRTETSTQSRTYSPPARTYNSTPSRSYGETTRSYNSGSSNSFNGGGMDRRSSGSNFSSGSSAGSSSGGSSRSSGGSSGSSSGRR